MFTLTAAEPALNRVANQACHDAAEVGWRLAEGTASAAEGAASEDGLRRAWDEGMEATRHHFQAPPDLWLLPRLANVLTLVFSEPEGAAYNLIVPLSIVHPGPPVPILTSEETRDCCRLLREIFGNRGEVLAPPRWQATWRTDTVMALAAQMYESRDFSAMPILADALQDAGCDNADVLDHCRGNGVHVRGCWVVDLLLGKA